MIHDVHEFGRAYFEIFRRLLINRNMEASHDFHDRRLDLHVGKSHAGTYSRSIAERYENATILEGLHATMFRIESFRAESVGIRKIF